MKQLKMKQKKKGRFLRMLIGALSASLLGNLLSGKRVIRAAEITFYCRAGILMSPHPLTNF